MTVLADLDRPCSSATDGAIAAINLESACRRAWTRFTQDPLLPGVAEATVDMERLKLQFLGDLDALDRLETLSFQFAHAENSFRAPLVQAEVASATHRFAEARDHIRRATQMGAPAEDIARQLLAIDQACGVALDDVISARRRIAAASRRLEDLVPLGALLADLERFDEANAVYQDACHSYDGTSPFPLAWVCFQLGVLWGELAPSPSLDLAAGWYRRALAYLPAYVKARVHLAEIYASQGRTVEAEALLRAALSSRDPEVSWRLADVLYAQGRLDESEMHLDTARRDFERLLAEHLLAFADHAAEFYAGSGNDRGRALDLARANVANRSTRRAIEQRDAITASARETAIASDPCEAQLTVPPCRSPLAAKQ